MKRNSIIEKRRAQIPDDIKRQVSLSFQIVDRIHHVLSEKGLKQKDLADMLGKNESEISKWMRGTHNFTIETLSSIESVLEEPIICVYNDSSSSHQFRSTAVEDCACGH